jgi:hypothetical protein
MNKLEVARVSNILITMLFMTTCYIAYINPNYVKTFVETELKPKMRKFVEAYYTAPTEDE